MMVTSQRTRVRMPPHARRDQLLAIGAELLAHRDVEDLQITEIADRAGVSRGLLYHYFPTKRDFVIAITQSACADMFADAEPDPSRPVEAQLLQVLDAYVRFAEQNELAYRAMHTGLIGDPQVRELRAQDLIRHEQRVLAAFRISDPPVKLQIAIRGWLTFVITAVLEWLADRTVPREELVRLCADTLIDVMRRNART